VTICWTDVHTLYTGYIDRDRTLGCKYGLLNSAPAKKIAQTFKHVLKSIIYIFDTPPERTRTVLQSWSRTTSSTSIRRIDETLPNICRPHRPLFKHSQHSTTFQTEPIAAYAHVLQRFQIMECTDRTLCLLTNYACNCAIYTTFQIICQRCHEQHLTHSDRQFQSKLKINLLSSAYGTWLGAFVTVKAANFNVVDL